MPNDTLDVLLGLSSPENIYLQAQLASPVIHDAMRRDGARETFERLYDSIMVQINGLDRYFSQAGDLTYTLVMRSFTPAFNWLARQRQVCEEIDRIDSCFYLSLAYGVLTGLEFRKRMIGLRQNPGSLLDGVP